MIVIALVLGFLFFTYIYYAKTKKGKAAFLKMKADSLKKEDDAQIDDKKPCPNCKAINWKESLIKVRAGSKSDAAFFFILGITCLFLGFSTGAGAAAFLPGSVFFLTKGKNSWVRRKMKKIEKVLTCEACGKQYKDDEL